MKFDHRRGSVGLLASLLCIATLAGCGSSKTVSGLKGKVTYKGEAIADAKVQVQSPANGGAGVARTDATGAYSIADLPPGQYNVTVAPFEEPPPAPLPPNYTPKDNPKIPKKYRNAKTSGLTFEAKAGSNEFNVEMVD